ncbi:uncharacterized protein LOC133799940 [Humulus lupulus]|uniref:uncharacterized protein LOC133799940 n=1 Tax=Humulus lupulus TaxID=3486 RepID=UPI002B4114D6|nr:uncharacterized protein LOC133799940 [Humulus lupulus]
MSSDEQERQTSTPASIPTTIEEQQSSSARTDHHMQVLASRSPIEDPANPYYLHYGDNPGNTLVSQLLTGQDNYVTWSRAMRLAISVENKLGFLDDSISKPSISDLPLDNAWLRNNNIVISWILNSVSKEISSSILYDESASAIWNDLKTRFHQRNGPYIFNLKKDLMNLKQDS